MNIGGPEMILIFLVVLLLFGGKKLPELARGLGKGLREFKDASDGIKREIHNNINTASEATADMDKAEGKINTMSDASADMDDPENKTADATLTPDGGISDETEVPGSLSTEHNKIAH
ncbi:MAG: twin-arginine translocase TatA/TatE family subunit [Daejeonella sp.]